MNNNLVRIWGTYSLNYGATFQPLFRVALPTMGSMENVPWDHTLGVWWDYHGIGVDPVNFSFLDAWGGDARLDATHAGIWSSRIQ